MKLTITLGSVFNAIVKILIIFVAFIISKQVLYFANQ